MENRLWRYLVWIFIGIIFISIGYGLGYTKGFAKGTDFAIKIGLHFVDINVNEEEMIRLIKIYQFYCKDKMVNDCLTEWKANTTLTI